MAFNIRSLASLLFGTLVFPGCLIRPLPPDSGIDASVATCAFRILEPPVSRVCTLPPGPADLVLSTDTPVPLAPACAQRRYDAIIILGSPSEEDGRPSSANLSRVDQAIRANCMGLGDRFIVTGAAVHNSHVEAEVLRDALIARGVPASRIHLEPQALHTDENIYYSSLIMQAQGWRDAVVASDLGHIRYGAECDTNCCVRLGRGTFLDFGGTPGLQLQHYQLVPDAPLFTSDECAVLQRRLQCVNESARNACAGRLNLSDAGRD